MPTPSTKSKTDQKAVSAHTSASAAAGSHAGLEDSFTLSVVESRKVGLTLDVDPIDRMLVGTGPFCALRVSDPTVARRHAAFRVVDRQLIVTDLGDESGTFVNDVRIREAPLSGGEKIKMGKNVVISVAREVRRGGSGGSGTRSSSSVEEGASFGRMLGESPVMKRLFGTLARFSANDAPLLLEGETGVGKELFAEELHALGTRALRPFVAVRGVALPPDALEEHLFAKTGLVARATGGTVFIDEIACLSPMAQKLIIMAIDTPGQPRFVFGTRRDLDREVERGRFEDSILQVLTNGYVPIPPLRERAGDIPILARAFWEQLHAADPNMDPADLPDDFLQSYESYTWPGNVRELSRAVRYRFYRATEAIEKPAGVGS